MEAEKNNRIPDVGRDNYGEITASEEYVSGGDLPQKRIHYILYKLKNRLLQIFFTTIFYFLSCFYSGYGYFLGATSGTPPVFQFLPNLLILVLISYVWGIVTALLGGLFGDVLYQRSTTGNISFPFLLSVLIIAVVSGISPYNKDTALKERHIIRFQICISAAIVSGFLPVLIWLPEIAVSYLVSEVINLFIPPVFIMAITDRLLYYISNGGDVIYHPLLTHHSVVDSDHTVPAVFDGYYIFLCTRCTGTVSGLLFGLFMERLLAFGFGIYITNGTAMLLCNLFTIPGMIDWCTQKLGFRKSNDYLRLLTGFMLGMAIFLTSYIRPAYILAIMLAIYTGIFFTVYAIGQKKLMKFG